MTSMKIPTPLWLDCDPGHDDAFAMLLALYHPRLNLLGISTVHGNASLAHTTENARRLLVAFGREDMPVHPGAAKPFCRTPVHAGDIHGASGLEGTDLLPKLPAETFALRPRSVHITLGEMLNAICATPKGSAWIVATGALTNVALLFAAFPDLVDWIAGLSIMGGAVGEGFTSAIPKGTRIGNKTEWAEFNIYCDPEAAQAIFSNTALAKKTTLVPLDLTHQVLVTPAVLSRFLAEYIDDDIPILDTKFPPDITLRPMLYDLLTFFAKTCLEVFGFKEGPPLHDPVALFAPLGSSLDVQSSQRYGTGTYPRYAVNVVAAGPQTGRTMVEKLPSWREGITIPREVSVDEFWKEVTLCIRLAQDALVTSSLRRRDLAQIQAAAPAFRPGNELGSSHHAIAIDSDLSEGPAQTARKKTVSPSEASRAARRRGEESVPGLKDPVSPSRKRSEAVRLSLNVPVAPSEVGRDQHTQKRPRRSKNSVNYRLPDPFDSDVSLEDHCLAGRTGTPPHP